MLFLSHLCLISTFLFLRKLKSIFEDKSCSPMLESNDVWRMIRKGLIPSFRLHFHSEYSSVSPHLQATSDQIHTLYAQLIPLSSNILKLCQLLISNRTLHISFTFSLTKRSSYPESLHTNHPWHNYKQNKRNFFNQKWKLSIHPWYWYPGIKRLCFGEYLNGTFPFPTLRLFPKTRHPSGFPEKKIPSLLHPFLMTTVSQFPLEADGSVPCPSFWNAFPLCFFHLIGR